MWTVFELCKVANKYGEAHVFKQQSKLWNVIMKDSSEISFLKKEIEKSVITLKLKSKCNKRKTAAINGLSIVSGALITLTLGIDVSVEYVLYQKNIALILGAILTIVNGWGAVFDYRRLWARQKSTLLNLYQIENQLCYRESMGDSHISDLFEQYLRVWDRDSAEWRNIINLQQNKTMTNNKREISSND